MGGAEGTKLDLDFVEMERVSGYLKEANYRFLLLLLNIKSAYGIISLSLCNLQ